MSDEGTSLGPLFEALARAQAKVKGAAKDSINPHFKSKYADLASVWEACREALTSEGLSVAQTFGVVDTIVVCTTILGHKSGGSIAGNYPLNAVKSDPQGLAAAATYARRVSLAAMVGVAPEDDDGETAAGRGEARGAHQQQRQQETTPKPKPQDSRPRISKEDAQVVMNAARKAGAKTMNTYIALMREVAGVDGAEDIAQADLSRVIDKLTAKADALNPVEAA